jgi:hypothetical protein
LNIVEKIITYRMIVVLVIIVVVVVVGTSHGSSGSAGELSLGSDLADSGGTAKSKHF